MSTNPNTLDVLCSQLAPTDCAEYEARRAQFELSRDEFWRFSIVPDVFKQSDEETDENKFDFLKENFGRLKPWQEIVSKLQQLNAAAKSDNEVYKLFFLSRHGQGYHNLAHLKYGEKEWNEHWSKLDGDGNWTWGPDPELTELGKLQAKDNNYQWKEELKDFGKILPQKWYSSPFTRSIDTLIGTWEDIVDLSKVKPFILENLRETIGVHTCDKRSARTIIAKKCEPVGFEIEPDLVEEDIYWKPDYRETIGEQAIRMNESFQYILDTTSKDESIISITSHSGSIRAQLLVLGHRPFAVGTGGMIPVFVKATKQRHSEKI